MKAERGAMSSRFLVRAALYAALYAALTLAPGLNALAYGQVQFRLSEALMVFACVDPAAVAGLTIGTALGNMNSPMFVVDVLFGSLLTLVAASLMQRLGPRYIALLVPVVVNGLGVAAMLAVVLDLPFWASAVWVGAGEAAVMTTAGAALLFVVRQRRELFGLTRPAA
ncbi:MAG: QueT transporter family protein [Thermoleophilia bacterium]